MMATQNLRLGPSYPSTSVMPAPNSWRKRPVKRMVVNEAADGSAYAHYFATRYQWAGGWEEISNTDMSTVMTELNRTRTLALIDFDSSSYTVLADPESITLEMVAGTAPPLWNIQVTFRQMR